MTIILIFVWEWVPSPNGSPVLTSRMKNIIYARTQTAPSSRLEYLLSLDPLPCLLDMMAMTQVRPQKSTWHLAPGPRRAADQNQNCASCCRWIDLLRYLDCFVHLLDWHIIQVHLYAFYWLYRAVATVYLKLSKLLRCVKDASLIMLI